MRLDRLSLKCTRVYACCTHAIRARALHPDSNDRQGVPLAYMLARMYSANVG